MSEASRRRVQREMELEHAAASARARRAAASRGPTPKQVLVAHIESCHGGFNQPRFTRLYGKPSPRWTMDRLATWHAHQHHQFAPNHHHAGPNTGPGNRPPGWRTGEHVVMSER